ncbi:Serine/threonine-protein kinase smu1 [Chytridiales sp. JEL 0842]|nr:Serine/threonine-protein kinase smu1 [Chytridiales sp. JEL 0842]
MEIESGDVIRLIEQFLKENNLQRTLKTLQEESSVSLNTVDSIEAFTADITAGKWDLVLKTVNQLNIPPRKLLDLYEHIVIELIEMKELNAARSLLRQTDQLQLLKDLYPDRYLHLEHLLTLTYFDPRESYPNHSTKDKRRQQIAHTLSNEVTVVPPSRLLALLGQALKWQHSQGLLPPDGAYDLFRGTAPTARVEEDMPPAQRYQTIKFPKKAHAECVAFSADGQFMATGTLDGIIEIWNYMTAKIRRDLKYQAEENYMTMDEAVLCLAFSRDSETLVAGSQDGKIKVFKVSTGQCIRRFPAAHTQGVTAVSFNKDGSQVLSASFDHSVRIHGIKSGKMLKEFRGHMSFVNDVVFSSDGHKIVSASSDGTVKIWDSKSTDCLSTLTLYEGHLATAGAHSPTVHKILPMPKHMDHVVVCNKSAWVYIISTKGQVMKTFFTGKRLTDPKGPEVVTAIVSSKGDYIYAVTEENNLHSFHVEQTGTTESVLRISEAEVIALAHHPFSNILAVAGENGVLGLWKP